MNEETRAYLRFTEPSLNWGILGLHPIVAKSSPIVKLDITM